MKSRMLNYGFFDVVFMKCGEFTKGLGCWGIWKKDGLLLRNGKDLNRNFPTWRDLNSSRADLKELAAIQIFLIKTTLTIVFDFPVNGQAWYRLDGRWRPRPWLTTSWTIPSCSPSTSMMEPSWPIFLGMTSLSGIGFKRELSCHNFYAKIFA